MDGVGGVAGTGGERVGFKLVEEMDFVLITLAMVALIVLVLVLIARAYPGSGADLVGWKPTRDYETEAGLEQDDIRQMIAAQNEYRRKRGAEELTAAGAARMAEEDERVRSRGSMDEEALADLDRRMRDRRRRDEGDAEAGTGSDG